MKDFSHWLNEQKPQVEEKKPVTWVSDEDLEEVGVEEIEDRLYCRCCRCQEIFELDLSRKEAYDHGRKNEWYCGKGPSCCP